MMQGKVECEVQGAVGELKPQMFNPMMRALERRVLGQWLLDKRRAERFSSSPCDLDLRRVEQGWASWGD